MEKVMTSYTQNVTKVGSRTEELRKLFRLALPTMITQLLRFLNPSISIMVCGHLSREELDASSMATTLINVLGLSVDTGFATAFDTLFSQAYGSKQKKVLGLLLQRALCVVFLMFSVLACLHVNIVPLLILLKQDSLISSLTSEYLMYCLPGLACDFLFLTFGRYLQAQNIVLPMLCSSCLGTVLNALLQYCFVAHYSLGLRTSALCLSCSFAFMFLGVLTYLRLSKVFTETWPKINIKAALSNWGIIFRMGIPGVFMVALEEWCFEALTFVAGSMGEVTLGAHAIAFQIQSIIYMVPLGIFTAVNIRVGQRLGAFDPVGSHFAYTTALALMPVIALLTSGPVILFRRYLPLLFTEDRDVCLLASSLLPLLLVFQTFEGFAGVSEAVLLACGRQSTGAAIIFSGYYCIGMPFALILAYRTSLGIHGAWYGLATGFGITTLVYFTLAMRTNWVEEARHAHFNISIQRESLKNFNEEERNELLNGIAKKNNGMISNGESSQRNGLIPSLRNHLLENRQPVKTMIVKDRLTRCQLVLKCPSGGFSVRILLFFSLFCYWFAAIYISDLFRNN